MRAVRDRDGKVYLDYLQNGHGRLLVAPFCVRPLPGAPVSMPLEWSRGERPLEARALQHPLGAQAAAEARRSAHGRADGIDRHAGRARFVDAAARRLGGVRATGCALLESRPKRRSSLRKPVTLIGGQFGSRHFGTQPYLDDAVALTRHGSAAGALYRRCERRRRGVRHGALRVDRGAGAHRTSCGRSSRRSRRDEPARARGARACRTSFSSAAATSKPEWMSLRARDSSPTFAQRRRAVSYSQECRPGRSCSASDGFAGRARTPATTRPRRTSAWAWRRARSTGTARPMAGPRRARSRPCARASSGAKARVYGVPSGGALIARRRWQNARTRRAGPRVRGAAAQAARRSNGRWRPRDMSYSSSTLAGESGTRRGAWWPRCRCIAIVRSRRPIRPTSSRWLARVPPVGKRELRRGFPESARARAPGSARRDAHGASHVARDLGHDVRSPAGHLGMVVVGPAGARGDALERADRASDGPRRLSRGRADDAGLRRRHVPFRQPDAGRAQHRRHPVLQRERGPDSLDRRRVRADVARVVRVRAARRRGRPGVPRDHRARGARSRPARAVAGVHHADVRDDDACDAPRHRPRVRCARVPALRRDRGRRAVHGMRARAAAPERAAQPCRSRARAGLRPARESARDDARPRVDAAAALRHRRRRARRRVARVPVRPRERRPVARAHRRPAKRLHERRRRDRDAADDRRCDPRGARARRDARAVAARGRQRARRRPAQRDERGRRRAKPSARLLARPIRGERVAAIAPEASGKYRLVKR